MESDRFGAVVSVVGELFVLLYMSAFYTIFLTPAKSGFAMSSQVHGKVRFVKGLITLQNANYVDTNVLFWNEVVQFYHQRLCF